MPIQPIRSDDSSVVFNLRQLMQLEDERVQAERFAREAADRERAERDERARDEALRLEAERQAMLTRLRIEAEAAERAGIEREAALLRVRLEVEAAVRAAELARPRHDELPATRHSSRWFAATGVAVLVASALGLVLARGGLLVAPAPAPSPRVPAADGVRSQQLQEPRAEELAELRQRIAELSALVTAPARPTTALPPPRRVLPQRAATQKPGRNGGENLQLSAPTDELGSLDSNSNDPLDNL